MTTLSAVFFVHFERDFKALPLLRESSYGS